MTTAPSKSWLSTFLASPANQTGLIALGSTIAGAVMQYADHQIALSALVSGVVFGVVKIILPDNIAAATDGEQFVLDAINGIAAKNPAALSKVLADAAKVAGDFKATS